MFGKINRKKVNEMNNFFSKDILEKSVCPTCKADDMAHICKSHVPGTAAFRKNGWYCQTCKAGPYQLGSVTEADAARFALALLNK
jgi:hypothetical protein